MYKTHFIHYKLAIIIESITIYQNVYSYEFYSTIIDLQKEIREPQ